MADLYNTILNTYARRFGELKPKAQFHLASRLYLWCREPQAEAWLAQLQPHLTAHGDARASVTRLLKVTPAPLHVSGSLRQAYFDRFPDLRLQERVLFRLLFLHSVYGLDTRRLFYEFFDEATIKKQRDELLADATALRALSSFGVNFLYLLDRFVESDETSLPVGKLLDMGRKYNGADRLQRHLQYYFYTHCIIAESLFYSRGIPAVNKAIYLEMLDATEQLIGNNFEETTLDAKYEFLACCRLLGRPSNLEEPTMQESQTALSPEGYLVDPRLNTRRPDTLHNAKHRNVLFLLSQKPFQPIN